MSKSLLFRNQNQADILPYVLASIRSDKGPKISMAPRYVERQNGRNGTISAAIPAPAAHGIALQSRSE
jgi:hypothetical protein